MPSKVKDTFQPREIGEAVNNALVMARKPVAGEIPEERFGRKLRPYAIALVAPVTEALEEELIRPEEAVVILLAAALLLHMQHVMHSDKVPMGSFAKQFEVVK